nr:unnamed protein product [Spirometra erinaceieuropaei]
MISQRVSSGARILSSVLPRRNASALANLQSIISKELEGVKAAGTWKTERVITSKQAADVTVATDDVFSMDGIIAKLPKICELADRYGAVTFMDEYHATGFFGKTGKGTEEYYGMQGNVHTSTLDKTCLIIRAPNNCKLTDKAKNKVSFKHNYLKFI